MIRKTLLSIGECMVEMASTDGEAFRLGFAGDTLNTAWYARAALPDDWHVSYLTRLGTDPYSHNMLAFFDGNGIGTEHVTIDPARRPGLYLIQLTEGERRFTYWRDQAAAKGLADDAEALSAAMRQAGVIYFSGVTLAILSPDARARFLHCLAEARAAGCMTVFDPNIRPRLWDDADTMRRITMEAASASDIALPSFDDEAETFGDLSLEACAARYGAAGCGTVVVKNGGGPMLAVANGETVRLDGMTRLQPVDTTGAGDSFNGAFLAATFSGASLRDALEAGHGLSCRVIMHPGALIPMTDLRDG